MKSKVKLKFEKHWLVPNLEQAIIPDRSYIGWSILRDMRKHGCNRKYEIMDPEGKIIRLNYFKDVKRYIEERVNA